MVKLHTLVNFPTENFPNETYINGLRNDDESVVENLYAEFRTPVIQAVTSLGGGQATGKSFFRTALVEAAKQARAGTLSLELPFVDQLKSLAVAHFTDWMAERGQPMPEREIQADEPETTSFIPASDALRETRLQVDAWKKGEQKDAEGYALWQNIRRA